MNKNSFFAFMIILGALLFFQSPVYQKFYSEKILKKPYNEYIEKNKKETPIKEKMVEERKETVISPIKADSNQKTVDTIWVENEKLKVGISEKGAEIISIETKEYLENREKKRINILPKNALGAQLKIGNKSYEEEKFKCRSTSKYIIIDKSQKIEFEFMEENGDITKKVFEFNKNSYLINISINKVDLPGQKITILWNGGIKESDKSIQAQLAAKNVIHLSSGNNFQHLTLKNREKEGPIAGNYEWIGISEKYFFIAINNDSLRESEIKIEAIEDTTKKVNYNFEISRMAEKQEEKFSLYAGPKNRKELLTYNSNYRKIFYPVLSWARVILWSEKWFPLLAEKMLQLLLLIQSGVKDFGIAIIIITIITKIVTYPMTMSSMKSMEKMKDIQPKVNKIRIKHKNNPQKMNEEIMALYKKEGVNPLNPGCLPIFLQMPIFISLYVVLQYSIELRGASTIIIPWINDLSKPEAIFFLPAVLPIYGNNVAILPIINAVLTYFSQKKTITDPNQKMLIYFMPIFMLVFFNSFPSGIVLYWTFTSALQLIQQAITSKINKK